MNEVRRRVPFCPSSKMAGRKSISSRRLMLTTISWEKRKNPATSHSLASTAFLQWPWPSTFEIWRRHFNPMNGTFDRRVVDSSIFVFLIYANVCMWVGRVQTGGGGTQRPKGRCFHIFTIFSENYSFPLSTRFHQFLSSSSLLPTQLKLIAINFNYIPIGQLDPNIFSFIRVDGF